MEEIFTCSPTLFLAWGYPERLSQIWVVWIFAWFGVPPPLFFPKIEFWLRGDVENFIRNHNPLLAWDYPESLSKIRVGWIFAWFRVVSPLFFCLKFSLGWGEGGGRISPPMYSIDSHKLKFQVLKNMSCLNRFMMRYEIVHGRNNFRSQLPSL